MKKCIFFAVTFTVLGSLFAQSNDTKPFDIRHNWDKSIGYSYQAGYPYGFALAGGTFMTFGFSDGESKYRETTNLLGVTTDYYEPTWSMRFGWIGYSIDEDVTGWGAVTFRPFVNLGMDFMKHYTKTTTGWSEDSKTYFTFAPSFGMNVYMFNFFVGYEIVPKFKELNGINFGIGFSVPNKNGDASENIKNKAIKNKKN